LINQLAIARNLFLIAASFVLTMGAVAGEVRSEVNAPEALDQVVLSIPPQQVVGQPLVGPAQILLLDEFAELLTDYDLAANPIIFSSSDGILVPDILNDPSLFSNGIIDLIPAGIRYIGSSGPIEIVATTSSQSSQSILVSFNRFDILNASTSSGDSISTIHADLATTVKVQLNNQGDLIPTQEPGLRAFFLSGGGSVKVFWNTGRSNEIDTVSINLPTDGLALGFDTLVLIAESKFSPADDTLLTEDSLLLPVTILPAMSIELAPGSLYPDSVYPGRIFDLSFDITTTGLPDQIDSAYLRLPIFSATDSIIAIAFDGAVDYIDRTPDQISYGNLTSGIDSAAGLTPAQYRWQLDYTLYVNGQILTLTDSGTDSVFVLPIVSLDYVEHSLVPTLVATGVNSDRSIILFLKFAGHCQPRLIGE